MIRSLVVCLILVLVAPVYAEPELKGTPDELAAYLAKLSPTVSLSGTGEVRAEADRAVLRFRLTVSRDSLRGALEAERRLRGEATVFLTGRGIPAGDIHAAQFAWSPQTGWFGKKPNSYEVQNTLKVTVTTPQRMEQAAGLLEEFKDVQFQSVSLENSGQEQLRSEATAKALADVERKRQAYEKGLGVKLSPMSVTAADEPMPPLPARLRVNDAHEASSSLRTAEVEAASVQSMGDVVLTARVVVRYRVVTEE